LTAQQGTTLNKPKAGNKPQPGSSVVIAVLIAVILVGVVMLGRHFLAPQTPTIAQQMDLDKHPIPGWITGYAEKCQGDMSKLSAEEQQKVQAAYPGQGARVIIMAAYANKRN